jgi:peptidoglycan/xylan/chitin deacetylase (PgdA/CDA1 family)
MRASGEGGRRLARLLGEVGALLLFLLSPAAAAEHAVILQYHHFGEDTPTSTSVTPAQFGGHLEYLDRNEFAVWPVEKIVSFLRKGKSLPENCVGITIDDAYISVYEKAFPLLKERGLPFTVFVATEGVDRGYRDLMTWEQMREMQSFNASFSGHSHSHTYLVQRREGESTAVWSARVKKDVETSLARLREELGSRSRLFAYPYGEYNSALRKMMEGMGLVVFSQQSGPVWAGSDFAALPRFPMASSYADMEQFTVKVRSLPLPVRSADPDDPLLPPEVSLPRLRLTLAPGDYRRDSLACYADGQGRIRVEWTDREGLLLKVEAHRPLPAGRSKYTCTAPSLEGDRYYWYSHLWIRPAGL